MMTFEDWLTMKDDCTSCSLSEELKIIVILAHLVTYPIVLHGFWVAYKRSSDLKSLNVNLFLCFTGFFAEWLGNDYFISNHINDFWCAIPERTILECVGFVAIVMGNVFFSYSLSMNQGNKKCLNFSLNLTLLVLLLIQPYLYYNYQAISVVNQVLTSCILCHRLIDILGESIKCYAYGYVLFGMFGGICDAIIMKTCKQELHIAEALLFGMAGIMLNMAFLKFNTNHKLNNQNYIVNNNNNNDYLIN